MVRKQITIREDQEAFLKTLKGSDSGNIQIALDVYKLKITPKAIASPSKKGGK